MGLIKGSCCLDPPLSPFAGTHSPKGTETQRQLKEVMDGGETKQGAAAGRVPLPGLLMEGIPSTAIRKAAGESVVGLKRDDAEGWLRAPREGVGPYLSAGGNCHW